MLRDEFSIRRMRQDEVGLAIEWAKEEGWNPGIYDANTFYKADPTGFFIGEIAGEAVTVTSSVAYGEGYGFLGLYITKPSYRKLGLGLELTKVVQNSLKGRNIGLDGVLENVGIYKRIGFVPYYHHRRCKLIACSKKRHPCLVSWREVKWEDIKSYDRKCFPEERPEFLKHWFIQGDSLGLVYVDRNKIRGFGFRRKCYEGNKVGPLFADTPEIAVSILDGLQEGIDGENLYVDIPDNHINHVKFRESLDLEEVFVTARMYSNGLPDIESDKIFGITTMELG